MTKLPRLRRLVPVLMLAMVAPLLAACAAGPQPVHWGVEECTHCRMVIGDERFAGQVVDRRGKTYKFDALECMAAWLSHDDTLPAGDVNSVWIASGRDGWIRVEDATFLHSDGLRSPMGGGYSGFASADEARRLQAEVGGEVLNWDQLRARAATHDHGAHAGHAPHDADPAADSDVVGATPSSAGPHDHAGHGAGAH